MPSFVRHFSLARAASGSRQYLARAKARCVQRRPQYFARTRPSNSAPQTGQTFLSRTLAWCQTTAVQRRTAGSNSLPRRRMEAINLAA